MQGLVVIAQPLESKGSVKGQVGTVTPVIPFSCCLLIVSFCCLEADYLSWSFPNIIVVVVVVGCRPWLSEAARGRILGDECKRLDLCWPQWVHFGSQEHHRTSWNSMESHGTSWNPTEPHGIPRNLMEGSGTWQNLLVADKWLQMMTSLNVSRTFQELAVCL
jgi:hypothetical protein